MQARKTLPILLVYVIVLAACSIVVPTQPSTMPKAIVVIMG